MGNREQGCCLGIGDQGLGARECCLEACGATELHSGTTNIFHSLPSATDHAPQSPAPNPQSLTRPLSNPHSLFPIPYSLLIICFLLFACNNVLIQKNNSPVIAGYGKISIDFVAGNERSLFPVKIFDRYAYTFTKEGEASGVEKIPDSEGFFTLEIGTYTVAVQAFIGSAEPYTLAANGVSPLFNVGHGSNAPVTVYLSEIDTAGKGEFSYTVTFPAGANAIITLQKWPDMDSVPLTPSNLIPGNGITETLELEAGSYLLTLFVSKGGLSAGTSEAVHIRPLLSTEYAKEFNDNDFLQTNFIVTFDANSAASGLPPAPQIVSANFSITLPGPGTLSKTGYIFGGWDTTNDGTGTTYSAGASYLPTGSVILYARWDTGFIVTNTAEWHEALSYISSGGNNRNYTITVAGDLAGTAGIGVYGTGGTGFPGSADNSFGGASNISVTIRGNGKLYLISQGSIVRIRRNQNLYIEDLALEGLKSGQNGLNYDNTIGVVYIDGGNFTMQGSASVYGNTTSANYNFNRGAGVKVDYNGNFIMRDNASVYGNTSADDDGGGVSVEGGNFTMQDNASVYGNKANDRGGGIIVWGRSNFTMKGNSSVHGNTALHFNDFGYGGGIWLGDRDSSFTMQDNASVYGNFSSEGSGVYVAVGGNFTMHDRASIHSNTSNSDSWGGSGGGVYVDFGNMQNPGGNFIMKGSASVFENTASRGGGVYVKFGNERYPQGTFIMQDNTSVHGNTANGTSGDDGGGGVLAWGDFTMQDNASVYGNTAFAMGGGVSVRRGALILLGGNFLMQDSASVHGNISSSHGGGVYINTGILTMQGGASVYNNTSGQYGGGIANLGTFRISGGIVYGSDDLSMRNTAGFEADALMGSVEYGTFSGDIFIEKGSLSDTNNTIRVAGGDLITNVFIPVTGISDLPSSAAVLKPLVLNGTVHPENASNQSIIWSVQNAGGAGAAISGNILNTTSAGTVTVRAIIANGLAVGTPYTHDFNITVTAAPSSIRTYEESVQKVTFTGNTATLTFNNLDLNDIYLVKVNTSETLAAVADTGIVQTNGNGLPVMGHPAATQFQANPPPLPDITPAPSGMLRSFIPPAVGDTRNFFVETSLNSGSFEQKQATLRAAGTHGNIWVMDENYSTSPGGERISSAQANALAENFDIIYPLATNLLGFEYGGGPGGDGGRDGDPKIQILVYSIGSNVLGYFWAKDWYEGYPGGNNAEILYIDAGYVNEEIDLIYSTLAHELQHMIHWNEKQVKRIGLYGIPDSPTWYNEMFSMMTEDILGSLIFAQNPAYMVKQRMPGFLASYYQEGIAEWGGASASYATKYMFGAYLLRNYGGAELVKRLMSNDTVGIDSITSALHEFSAGLNFEQVLSRYSEAMIFSGPYAPQGVVSFEKAHTDIINGITYTVHGFDIWDMQRASSTEKGPVILDLLPRTLRPRSVSVHSVPQWKYKTGSYSITVERPNNPDVELYLMVR